MATGSAMATVARGRSGRRHGAAMVALKTHPGGGEQLTVVGSSRRASDGSKWRGQASGERDGGARDDDSGDEGQPKPIFAGDDPACQAATWAMNPSSSPSSSAVGGQTNDDRWRRQPPTAPATGSEMPPSRWQIQARRMTMCSAWVLTPTSGVWEAEISCL